MTLPTPEEVASIILTLLHVPPDYFLKEKGRELIKIIIADRSRLIQHIREKMPMERSYSYVDPDSDAVANGWNSAIEAFEKILEEVK